MSKPTGLHVSMLSALAADKADKKHIVISRSRWARVETRVAGAVCIHLLAAVSLCCLGSVARGATTGNVSWSGEAGVATPYWNIDDNWRGGEAPANPTTATVTFTTNNASLTSVLDADRTIGTLNSGTIGVGDAGDSRTTLVDLAGHTLVVNTALGNIAGSAAARNTFIFTNGTVQIGSDAKAADLTVGFGATLRFAPGTTLNATNLGTLTVTCNGNIVSILDFRDAVVSGRDLTMDKLRLVASGGRAGRIYVNSDTALDALHVKGETSLGYGFGSPSYVLFLGDPDNPFTFEGQTYGYFPAGVDLRFGVSPANRGSMIVGHNTSYRAFTAFAVAPGGGGRFTAYLSSLMVAGRSYSAANDVTARCVLDVATMDTCFFDIGDLTIAPGIGELTKISDSEIGILRLPPGTGTVASATWAAADTRRNSPGREIRMEPWSPSPTPTA